MIDAVLDWFVDRSPWQLTAMALGLLVLLILALPSPVCDGVVTGKRFIPAHTTWVMSGKVMVPVHHADAWELAVRGETDEGSCRVDETVYHAVAEGTRLVGGAPAI